MSSLEYLREFVNERLTAAAEEIFGVFKRTLDEYEEELVRQRKMLAFVWKPEIKLLRTGYNLLLIQYFSLLDNVVSRVANKGSCKFLISYFLFCVSPQRTSTGI